MVHEQEYTIKIKVSGGSTMQMERFEDALLWLIQNPLNHKNLQITASTKNGKKLVLESPDYTFERYIGGRSYGTAKDSKVKPDLFPFE